MDVDIYKAKKSPRPREKKFVFVRAGADVNSLTQDLKEHLGELLFFKKMTIKRGEKRIALDSDEAISNIEANGYHIQGTKIEIKERM